MRIGWTLAKPFFASPKRGASTIVYLASSPDAAQFSGDYFVNSRRVNPSLEARDEGIAAELWKASAKRVAIAA
jgi:hypothetical protein